MLQRVSRAYHYDDGDYDNNDKGDENNDNNDKGDDNNDNNNDNNNCLKAQTLKASFACLWVVVYNWRNNRWEYKWNEKGSFN